jgi:hypothetical protein
MVNLAKKNDKLKPACHFFKSLGNGALMSAASTASAGPQIKEVHALNLHEANVDHQVITAHADHGNNEPDDGFWGDKFSLLFFDLITHFTLSLLMSLTG